MEKQDTALGIAEWASIIAILALAVGVGGIFLAKAAGLRWAPADQTQDSAPAEQIYKTSDFEHLVIGKSKKDVIALLGLPIAVNSGIDPGAQTYDYSPAEPSAGVSFRVVDDTTGLEQSYVMVRFDSTGHAEGFSY